MVNKGDTVYVKSRHTGRRSPATVYRKDGRKIYVSWKNANLVFVWDGEQYVERFGNTWILELD